MKILFPIGSFYPAQVGGPNNSVFAITKILAEQGNDVFVITTDRGIKKEHGVPLNEWTKIEGVNVFYGTSSSLVRYLPRGYKPVLRQILEKVDIVHLTSVFTIFSHIVARECLRANIPYVWSPRGELLSYTIRMKGLKKKLFLKIPFIRNHFRNIFFHVTSLEEKQDLQSIQKEYCNNVVEKDVIFDIPNIADNSIFEKKSRNQTVSSKPYILFLSRINRKKNIETLINAYSEFSLNKNYNLVIAGSMDEDAKYSEKLIKLTSQKGLYDQIIFTKNRVEGEHKSALYKNAKLLVLPSHSENFGMVILESLAQGTPVITTKNTPWGQIEEYNCGFWVEKDTASIKQAIEKYFSLDEQEKGVMAENSVKFARTFSPEVLGHKYNDMYAAILSHKATP